MEVNEIKGFFCERCNITGTAFDHNVNFSMNAHSNHGWLAVDRNFNVTLLMDHTSRLPSETKIDSFMPTWVKILWTIVYVVMISLATGGNCIVIWIVTAHRRMRTVTNYFLVNLSVADLLLTTLNCIFNFTYMIQRNWPFGSWYCIVSNFIAYATVAASVFTLTGISCDRYLAIVHPLHPRMSKTFSLIIVTFIWLASMFLAFPCLLYSTTITNSYKGHDRTGCILIWPDGKVIGSEFDFAYQMVFLIITYIIPVILMTLCYTIMGRELWGSRSIGELTQRQIDSIRSKRKVVKMFISVVFIFAICWLPYHGYFLYIYYDTEVIFKKYTQHVYLGFYWFAMSNAMVNPLIYYWMNARFRKYFKMAICGWKSCGKSRSGESNLSPDRSFKNFQGGNSTIILSKRNSVPEPHHTAKLRHQNTLITKIQTTEEKPENVIRNSLRLKRSSLRSNRIKKKTTANL